MDIVVRGEKFDEKHLFVITELIKLQNQFRTSTSESTQLILVFGECIKSLLFNHFRDFSPLDFLQYYLC